MSMIALSFERFNDAWSYNIGGLNKENYRSGH